MNYLSLDFIIKKFYHFKFKRYFLCSFNRIMMNEVFPHEILYNFLDFSLIGNTYVLELYRFCWNNEITFITRRRVIIGTYKIKETKERFLMWFHKSRGSFSRLINLSGFRDLSQDMWNRQHANWSLFLIFYNLQGHKKFYAKIWRLNNKLWWNTN